MAEFFLWVFLEEKKRILKVLSKKWKIKRIFSLKNVFKPREQKQKTKESFFPHFRTKKHILIFWIHQKGEKRETEYQKKTGYKTRNHFSRHRKRPNMEKKPKRKVNRENEVFL